MIRQDIIYQTRIYPMNQFKVEVEDKIWTRILMRTNNTIIDQVIEQLYTNINKEQVGGQIETQIEYEQE